MKVISINCLFITIFSFLHAEKLAEYKLLALKGDMQAQVYLGKLYSLGRNKDLKEAYYWMKLAARNNSPYACFQVGICHLNGTGTSSDINLSKEWFNKSAKMGNIQAMEYLGKIFEFEQNWIKSAIWYRLVYQLDSQTNVESYNRVIDKLNLKEINTVNTISRRLESEIQKDSNKKIFTNNVTSENFVNQRLTNDVFYTGKMKDGIPHGYGKKFTNSGVVFIGDFKNGLEHGYGTSFNKDGIISYQGIWNAGNPNTSLKKDDENSFTNY